MKRKMITAVSLSAAALVSLGIISIPAIIMNASVSSISIAETANIYGQVTYLENVKLPDHATLIVQLVDVSDPNGAIVVVSEFTKQPKSQVPLEFNLPLDRSKIKQNDQYALQARILVGDVLWFVSDTRLAVDIDNLNKNYQINLAMVNQNSANTPTPPTEINGIEWIVQNIFNSETLAASHMTISVENKSDNVESDEKLRFKVTGSGSCNRYSTILTMNKTDNTISFAAPSMTFIACSDKIAQQENRFIDMLSKAKSYEFDDLGRLYFNDSEGQSIARLVPNL